MPARPIARRKLLQAFGAASFLWPLANRVLADTSTPMKRLVLFMQNNGTQQANFWPTSNFNSRILDPLLSNARIAQKTILVKGVYVPLPETIRGFREIAEGKHDGLPEQAFYMVGTIDDAIAKAQKLAA